MANLTLATGREKPYNANTNNRSILLYKGGCVRVEKKVERLLEMIAASDRRADDVDFILGLLYARPGALPEPQALNLEETREPPENA